MNPRITLTCLAAGAAIVVPFIHSSTAPTQPVMTPVAFVEPISHVAPAKPIPVDPKPYRAPKKPAVHKKAVHKVSTIHNSEESASTPVEKVVSTPVTHVATSGGFTSTELRIRQCESGGDYTDANPTSSASGAWEFLDSTWADFGGYPRAMDAPPSVQDEKAHIVFAADGTTPWAASESCWG